jgi:hypothetical protein
VLVKECEYLIVSYDMIHLFMQDNGYGLNIIQVNSIFKEIFDYVMMDFGSNNGFVIGAPCRNEGHGYNLCSSMATRHPRLESVFCSNMATRG